MFLSQILPYQDPLMIAFLGLIILILFLCRITYSILAHFYLVYLTLKSPTLISFQLCLQSSKSYLHRYSSYCGSIKIISTQVFFHTVVVLQSIYTGLLPYCGRVTIYLYRYSTILRQCFNQCGPQQWAYWKKLRVFPGPNSDDSLLQ